MDERTYTAGELRQRLEARKPRIQAAFMTTLQQRADLVEQMFQHRAIAADGTITLDYQKFRADLGNYIGQVALTYGRIIIDAILDESAGG